MSIEFPLSGDRLFRNDLKDWPNNAVLNWGTRKLPFYAEGYRVAAKAAISECEKDRTTNDILVYPIVFLYRQYIELRLKEILSVLRYCNGETCDFPNIHVLNTIWLQVKEQYQELGESANSEDFQNGNRLILEFDQIDDQSMAFRYPVDTKGKDTLSLSHMNIRNFGEVMERLSRFLDAISDHAAHFEDLTNDMRRDNDFGFE